MKFKFWGFLVLSLIETVEINANFNTFYYPAVYTGGNTNTVLKDVNEENSTPTNTAIVDDCSENIAGQACSFPQSGHCLPSLQDPNKLECMCSIEEAFMFDPTDPTMAPTTEDYPTEEPTTVEPPTEEPPTEEPTTVEPTTEEPTTVEPTTVEPTTVEPPTEEPTTVEPPTEEPPTEEPPTEEPTTEEPTTVEPTTVEPTTVEPTTVEPTTVEPTTVEPPTEEPPTEEPQTDCSITDETTTDYPTSVAPSKFDTNSSIQGRIEPKSSPSNAQPSNTQIDYCAESCPNLSGTYQQFNCMCRSDSPCIHMNAICTSNNASWGNCVCDSLTIENGAKTKCLPLANHLGSDFCTEEVQCRHMNANCSGLPGLSTCLCTGNSVPNSENILCLPRVNLTRPCSETVQCSHLQAECTNSQCLCNTTLTIRDPLGEKCLLLAKNLGDSCELDAQCSRLQAKCTGVSNFTICSCNATNEVPNLDNDLCIPKIYLGSKCNETKQCEHMQAECIGTVNNSFCSCNRNTTVADQSNTTCLPLAKSLGATCAEDVQCMNMNSTCTGIEGSIKICSCNGSYSVPNSRNDTCLLKCNLNTICIETSQCEHIQAECLGATSNKHCSCDPNLMVPSPSNTTCLEKVTRLDNRCSETVQCSHMEATCLNSACHCSSGTHFPNLANTFCLTSSNLRGTCNETKQCEHLLAECIGLADNSICDCNNDSMIANSAKTRCLQIATAIGDTCEEDVQCSKITDNSVGSSCVGIPGKKTCKSKEPSVLKCSAKDEYGRQWNANADQTQQQVCPSGSLGQCYWKCLSTGLFEGATPYYKECRSEWVGSVISKIEDVPVINLNEASDIVITIESSLKSALASSQTQTPDDTLFEDDVFGFEIFELLECLQNLTKKLSNEETSNINIDWMSLAFPITNSISTILEYSRPWKQMSGEEKTSTFSKLLATTDTVSLELARKCSSQQTTPQDPDLITCSPNFFYDSGETIVEINTYDDETVSTVFPGTGEHIRGKDTFIKLPQGAKDFDLSVGTLLNYKYPKSYGNSFSSQAPGDDDRLDINANLIGLTVSGPRNASKLINGRMQLTEPVEITFAHVNYAWGSEPTQIRRKLHVGETPKAVTGSAKCVFWDVGQLAWSSEGCEIVSSSSFSTVCSCNHLTSFTLVMKFHKYIGKSPFLMAVIIFAFVVFVMFLIYNAITADNSKSGGNQKGLKAESKVVKHLGLVLTVFCYFLILFFSDRHFFDIDDVECYVIGAFSHTLLIFVLLAMSLEFLMATVDFMVITKLESLQKLAIKDETRQPLFYVGRPFAAALLMAIAILVVDYFDGPDSRAYGGDFCWLEGSYVWALFGPMVVLLLMDMILLGTIFWNFRNKTEQEEAITLSGVVIKNNDVKRFAKKGVILVLLISVTWVVGFFQFGPYYVDSWVLSYAFPVLSMLQASLMNSLYKAEGTSYIKKMWAWLKSRGKKPEDDKSSAVIAITEDSPPKAAPSASITFNSEGIYPKLLPSGINGPIKGLTIVTNEEGQLMVLQFNNNNHLIVAGNENKIILESDEDTMNEAHC